MGSTNTIIAVLLFARIISCLATSPGIRKNLSERAKLRIVSSNSNTPGSGLDCEPNEPTAIENRNESVEQENVPRERKKRSGIPVSDYQIPKCINLNLEPDQYRYFADTGDLDVVIGQKPLTIHDFNATETSGGSVVQLGNVTVCYPLSPQLLNCPTVKYRGTSANVFVNRNLTLFVDDRHNVTAYLGDYLVDEAGDFIACSQVIDPHPDGERCNYVTLLKSEIQIMQNGSLKLISSNETLKRPGFLIDTPDWERQDSFNVCWPLSIEFLNCPFKLLVDIPNIQIQTDHKLFFKLRQIYLGLNEYFRVEDRVVICLSSDDSNTSTIDDSKVYTVYTGFYIVSCVCLVITFVYQLMVPKVTYHAKCLLCHLACLFFMYVCTTLKKFLPGMSPPSCYALFAVMYVSYMSAFFWLNILSFDVWLFFSRMQTARFRMPINVHVESRFLCYSLYAWGFPVVLCCLSFLVEMTRGLQKLLSIFPEITGMCWFNQRTASWVFYHGPLAVLMLMNLIFFIFTVMNLFYASKGTEMINHKKNSQLFIICLKLFVVMGLCWVLEVLFWSITSDKEFNYYWYISNVFISLQGVAIFFVYTFKQENYDCIRRRLCPRPPNRKWTAFPEFTKVEIAYSNSNSALSDTTTISTTSLSESTVGRPSLQTDRDAKQSRPVPRSPNYAKGPLGLSQHQLVPMEHVKH